MSPTLWRIWQLQAAGKAHFVPPLGLLDTNALAAFSFYTTKIPVSAANTLHPLANPYKSVSNCEPNRPNTH
jgi:hypothetical protein